MDMPKITERKILVDIAPVRADPAPPAIVARA